jgi:hypothetical protein
MKTEADLNAAVQDLAMLGFDAPDACDPRSPARARAR